MGPVKKGKPANESLEQQDILQAVVVADRFDSRFQPLTDKMPLALFPVANRPLIEYTMDFLASSGIQHVYVYCSQHCQLIKEYFANSKWKSSPSTQCQVTVIVSPDLTSLGDVLRDVDQKALFESDFFLIPGDVVSNMSLDQALKEHRDRRARDKNKPLMTLLLRDSSPSHTARSSADDIAIALNTNTQQVLYYQKTSSSNRSKIKIPLRSLLQDNCSKFDLRYDLTDTGVAICSPQVPQLFTDNFDYQTADDFIRGILINEEFLGNQIHVHTIQKYYASRVSTLHMYDMVSRAVISRWTYPFVPDNDFESLLLPVSQKSREQLQERAETNLYRHLRRNVYLGKIKSLGKASSIEDNSIIGHNATIGDNCHISNSVIGCDCRIEDNVTIQDSYIWRGAIVKSGCVVRKTVLCDETIVHENCQLEPHCILTAQVEIGPDVKLAKNTVIHTDTADEGFDDDEDKNEEYEISVVGSKGKGVLWNVEEEDAGEDEIALVDGIWGMSLLDRDHQSPPSDKSQSSDEDEISSEEEIIPEDRSDDDDDDNSLEAFYNEAKDSLMRGVEENINPDNLVLEINSSKYANNVSVIDVVHGVTRAAFEIAFLIRKDASFFVSLKKVLTYLSPVFINYQKNSQAQMECLYEIERYCIRNKHASECLMKILNQFYDKDILHEEVILHWHKKPKPDMSAGDVTPEKLRTSVNQFIQWLQEAEEESSGEDS